MPSWPNGATAGALVTIHFDAETLWISKDANNRGREGVLSQGRFGARVGVDALLSVLERQGLRTTFFVPGAVAEQHPAVVRRIVEAGHEVAHHGYEHETLDPNDPAGEERILEQGLEALKACTDAPIVGYCAPSWQSTTATTGLLAAHGFAYATNLMDDIRPYVHRLKGGHLVELPVHWLLDDAPFRAFSSGAPRSLTPMRQLCEIWWEELAGLYAVQGLFNLTLHPQFSGRPSAAAAIDEFLTAMRKDYDLWIGRCDELAAHWLRAES